MCSEISTDAFVTKYIGKGHRLDTSLQPKWLVPFGMLQYISWTSLCGYCSVVVWVISSCLVVQQFDTPMQWI